MEKASSCSASDSSSSSDQSLSNNSDQTTQLLASSMLSRTSSSSSSAVDDYIGTESCFDVLSEEGNSNGDVVSPPEPVMSKYRYGGRRREEREARAAAAREIPPPIPSLAQTGNLHPHMPWVLKRVVTSDGRLILREEKVRHHEYFRAHRSNGRLTLHLVPLDDDVFELPSNDADVDEEEEEVEEEEEEHDHDDVNVTDTNGDDGGKENVHGGSIEDGLRKVILVEETVMDGMVGGGGSPRGKCLKSCFVDMRIREIIRPVLS